jgi:hypothetical protein
MLLIHRNVSPLWGLKDILRDCLFSGAYADPAMRSIDPLNSSGQALSGQKKTGFPPPIRSGVTFLRENDNGRAAGECRKFKSKSAKVRKCCAAEYFTHKRGRLCYFIHSRGRLCHTRQRQYRRMSFLCGNDMAETAMLRNPANKSRGFRATAGRPYGRADTQVCPYIWLKFLLLPLFKTNFFAEEIIDG